MFSTLVTLLVTVMLVVGSTGGTVYAAQDSLPKDFLYPVKTLSEDVRLDATVSNESKIALAMEFASRRVDEIAALAADGEAVPTSVIDRWEAETEMAFVLAASLDDDDFLGSMKHIERHLRDQDRTMGMTGAPEGVEPVLAHVLANIQHRLRLVESGQEDPLAFRNYFRMRFQAKPGEGAGDPAFGVISDTLPCPDCDPLMNGTGSGIGPGPGPISDTVPCPECGPFMSGGEQSGAGEGQVGEPGYGPGEPGYGPGSAVNPDPNPEPDPNQEPGLYPNPTPLPQPPNGNGNSGSGQSGSSGSGGQGNGSASGK